MPRQPGELADGWRLRPPLARAAGGGIVMTVHKDLAELVGLLLDASVDQGYEFAGAADDWGYAHREVGGRWTDSGFVGGVGVWSMHAYGVAVDVNAADNPRQRTLRTDIPARTVARWEDHGFYWGGRFKTPDPMHFEYRRPRTAAADDTERARQHLQIGGLMPADVATIIEKLDTVDGDVATLRRRVEFSIETTQQCRSRLDNLAAAVKTMEGRFGFELDELRQQARRLLAAVGYPTGKWPGMHTVVADGVDVDRLPLAEIRGQLAAIADVLDRGDMTIPLPAARASGGHRRNQAADVQ